jgi:NitT/TauT family transport system substrate-binding protein
MRKEREERSAGRTGGLSRRRFLTQAATGIGVTALGMLSVEPARGQAMAKVRWISPRGTLQVMDDFNLWVPVRMGYFKTLGIEAELIAGPIGDALATTKFVGQNQADMGYPSPGVLTASLDSGVPVKSVWNVISGQVFDFAVKKGSPIRNPKDLVDKTISLGSEGWRTIVDPMLVEIGVDPKSVKYVVLGLEWIQAAATGKADVALAWEGLRNQWLGQGLKLDFLIGSTWSKQPSNVYAVRRADLADQAKAGLYTRFLQGVVMGLEFTKANPRGAAQITYGQLPELRKTLKPQMALYSMLELAQAYATSHRQGQPWGWHYPEGWQGYLDTVYKLGQVKTQLKPDDVYTNDLVQAANTQADRARATADAQQFKLDADFAATQLWPGFRM